MYMGSELKFKVNSNQWIKMKSGEREADLPGSSEDENVMEDSSAKLLSLSFSFVLAFLWLVSSCPSPVLWVFRSPVAFCFLLSSLYILSVYLFPPPCSLLFFSPLCFFVSIRALPPFLFSPFLRLSLAFYKARECQWSLTRGGTRK